MAVGESQVLAIMLDTTNNQSNLFLWGRNKFGQLSIEL